ncbi:SDR family oxidoreductase [Shouchella clausii]|uniref:SDR family oxidoreductase n=1 Tax=Shouchella clausii TaxID=79880 RepID=UPI0039831231
MNKIENYVTIITGAGTGVGKATAKLLASKGVTVYLIGRRREKLEEVAKEIGGNGGRAYAYQADITKIEEVNNLKEYILSQESRIDIVINNAGVGGEPITVHDMTVKEWIESIELNLNSVFYITNAFLPKMREQKFGHVISLTSMMVNLNYEGFSAYASAKAGLEVFMKTLEVEEKKHGIHVSIIDPGNVRSEQNPNGKEDPINIARLIENCVLFPDEKKNGKIIKAYN